jgi:hypothetical protein
MRHATLIDDGWMHGYLAQRAGPTEIGLIRPDFGAGRGELVRCARPG